MMKIPLTMILFLLINRDSMFFILDKIVRQWGLPLEIQYGSKIVVIILTNKMNRVVARRFQKTFLVYEFLLEQASD